MNWPLAFIISTMWFSLLFFSFCVYIYIKEYKREEQYLKQLDETFSKPIPLVYYEDNLPTTSSHKKEKIVDNTSLVISKNKSKKNIN